MPREHYDADYYAILRYYAMMLITLILPDALPLRAIIFVHAIFLLCRSFYADFIYAFAPSLFF